MAKSVLNPAGLAAPRSSYSQVVVADSGQLVFLAGQTALDEQSRVVGIGDIRAQARQVFANIAHGLAAVGGGLSDITSLIVFTTDVRYNGAIDEVRRELFGVDFPAGTIVQVVALARPELLLEITATAVVPQR